MINTNEIKKFARAARQRIMQLVAEKLDYVLNADSGELRVQEKQINRLRNEVRKLSAEVVIEKAAYTWFNRFVALRFMDANGYNSPMSISPNEAGIYPEIFEEAKAGRIDEELSIDRDRFYAILDSRIQTQNPENAAFKMLLLAECNRLHKMLPKVFEAIEDYTELLLPEDLIAPGSILDDVRSGMSKEDCENEEIIGWLYQFYISEKKDEVIQAKKSYKKEDIPAATQLFTPHWIVEYLVDNTLGRFWIEHHPETELRNKLKYYISANEITKNEEVDITKIKFFDPCVGSGHILTYAFELFYQIYLEIGYSKSEIPALILKNNLIGLDIDERAVQLATLQLAMKARSKYSRFFRNIQIPQIIILNDIPDDEEFHNLSSIGSLAIISGKENDSDSSSDFDLFYNQNEYKKQIADILNSEYDFVVTNPPYLNSKYMEPNQKRFVEKNYSDTKSDLFACFMKRSVAWTKSDGYIGFVTPYVWMFIQSYEALRRYLIENTNISGLVQLEYNAFEPACVPVCCFTLQKSNSNHELKGNYIKLSDFRGSDNQPIKTLEAINNPNCGWFYSASQSSFAKIPGSPIAYWASEKVVQIFEKGKKLGDMGVTRKGMVTADNNRFIRKWYEVAQQQIGFNFNDKEEAGKSHKKWFPYHCGGYFRKWAGLLDSIVNFQNNGYELLNMKGNGYVTGSTNHNLEYIFKKAIVWNRISSSKLSARFSNEGSLFDDASPFVSIFDEDNYPYMIGYLNSIVSYEITKIISPTLTFQSGDIQKLPIIMSTSQTIIDNINNIIKCLISTSRKDWDSRETSWDFKHLRIAGRELRAIGRLNEICELWRQEAARDFFALHHNEEELNRIFIDIYGLQDELTPEVELKDVTILQQELRRDKLSELNSKIRHITNADTALSDADRQQIIAENAALLTADYFDPAELVKQLISYAVGCMMGRYSLDIDGLVIANQGDSLSEYKRQISAPSYQPDADGIIPVLEDELFTDDIVGRFREFIAVAYGEEHYAENIAFIEATLEKDIRKYFIKDFYNDHIKRYKKRPIYWLFSSPKRNFNALIYMHRYTPDMVAMLLDNYMREYRSKLDSKRMNHHGITLNPSVSAAEVNKSRKEMERIDLILSELKQYEVTLQDAALKRTEIDLDDGVRVNYSKFKDLLLPIKGMDKEE